MRCLYLLIGWLALVGPNAFASDETVEVLSHVDGSSPPSARIEDLSWLVGQWTGQGLGGSVEDIIAPASGGQMMGMFRHSKADGSVNFYEFYMFAEKDGSLTQRLKHFSPMLDGWEEKDEFVEFPLLAIEKQAAYFDGLSYRLNEDGSLMVGVRIEKDRIAVFEYQRVED